MKISNIYGIILAGGKGERLWPLSREKKPKQLLELHHKTLLEHTFDRLSLLIDPNKIKAVTTQPYADIISTLLSPEAVIIEPALRNTAAAILLSCLTIAQQDPEAVLVFSPADHYICNDEAFIAVLGQAVKRCKEEQRITLIGVKPTHPATGYGYIEYDKDSVNSIVRFHEKPNLATAELYYQSNCFLWNIGIFCAPVKIFIEKYQQLAPDLYKGIYTYTMTHDSAHYESVASISIDYALMEKSNDLLVIPGEFKWSDIGNLSTYLSIEESSTSSKTITLEASNNLVKTNDILTVLIGVQDLCIVQTNDVLLIAKKDEAEKVKQVLVQLQLNKLERYL